MPNLVTQCRNYSISYAPQLVLLGVTALFGLSNVAQIAVLKEVDSWLALGLRASLAVLCLSPFAVFELLRLWPTRHAVFKAMPVAVVSFSLGMCLQMTGASMTTATNLGFIINLGVVFTPLLCWVFGTSQLEMRTGVAITASLAGVAILSMGSATGLGLGDLLCLGAALCYSLWIIEVQRIGSQHNCLILMTTLQWLAPAFVGLCMAPSGLESLSQLSSSCWLNLLYIGCAASALGFLFAAKAQARMSATHAAVIYPTEAVFGAILATALLGEHMSAASAFGGCLTLLGVAMVTLPKVPYKLTTKKWSVA